ncbi:prolyl oligopeptidase family serine peptidase [Clostridium tarantellae]|uniref:Prolyl oligopeptidase family serine peptidase n=1 Tax=Clostridium tarantellae TaxID=39493 RepID=A0A6I1MMN1_9CLOT|nr:prolyl oligopeptidase family serine peptidase [Clostridium tarantellae]MPQ43387.1 prolyl oligopeptidase family serine peptidase [Clostridium tarantellae]
MKIVNKELKFKIITEVFDYGPEVTKIIIDTQLNMDKNTITKDTFKVISKNTIHNKSLGIFERKIINVYVSDSSLNSSVKIGQYIILELEHGMNVNEAKTLFWNEEKFLNEEIDLNYVIFQNKDIKDYKGNIYKKDDVTYKMNGVKNLLVDEFKEGKSESALNYRYFISKKHNEKNPLIIWLHGAGEGGNSNATQISGNGGVVTFITEEVQTIFGGAYILVPQTPTFWMPSFIVGNLELKGEKDYTKDVISLIKSFIKENSDVDERRIYIGGCSMGGFQTIKTLSRAPKIFAAAFLICPAYEPSKEDLEKIKNIPIWLIHASTDLTAPVSNSKNAYKILKELGANVIYTEYENIERDGNKYNSHAACIPVLHNDPVNNEGEHIFNWLSKQIKFL